MACLRLKPTSDAPLAQGLPAKIIRLHRSGRRAKAHISMKPDDFRRQFPELAEGRCAFSGAWSPLSRWRKRRCAARGTFAPARRLYRNADALTSRAAGWFRAPPCPRRSGARKKSQSLKACKIHDEACSDGGSGVGLPRDLIGTCAVSRQSSARDLEGARERRKQMSE